MLIKTNASRVWEKTAELRHVAADQVIDASEMVVNPWLL